MLRIPCLLLVPVVSLGVSHSDCLAAPQWSTDPSVNTALADGPSDQTQPKVVATPDGGFYVSWFDGIGSGFDVRVQKLDASGAEVFAHNGVLVADRNFSSTQDYGLAVDASGDALLAFRDDSGGGTQIGVAKVSPAGVVIWSQQVTSTSSFVAAPAVAGASDGSVYVAWTQGSSTHIQRLDSNGAAQWAADVVLSPGGGSYSASDLHAAGTSAILGFVHQTGGFGSPRHLLAQKVDSAGALQWGASHVPVFTAGSLQFGNFPDFVPDDAGGAVFSWYDTSSLQFNCSVQRVDAAGAQVFGPGGVTVSTNTSRVRVEPIVAFDPLTNTCTAFWREQSPGQSQSGVYGQRLDGSGGRMWSDEGVQVVGLSSTEVTQVRVGVDSGGAMVFWSRSTGPLTATLHAAHVGGAGAVDAPEFDVCSVSSGKSRSWAATTTSQTHVLAWKDERTDSGDVYVQAVQPDGSLGGAAGGIAVLCDPALDHYLGDYVKLDASSLGGAVGSGLHLEAVDGPAGEFGFFLVSAGASAALPVFSGVLCLDGPQGRYNPLVATNQGLPELSSIGQFDSAGVLQNLVGTSSVSSGYDVPVELPFSPPGQVILPGSTWAFTCWYRDQVAPLPNPGSSANFSNVVEVTFP